MAPTLAQAIGTYVPVVVVLIASWFTWRGVRKTTDTAAKTEGRKADLAEFDALNKAQAAELERVRADREEDRVLYVARLGIEEQRARAAQDYAAELCGVLRHPKVAAILQSEGIEVPSAPTERRELV